MEESKWIIETQRILDNSIRKHGDNIRYQYEEIEKELLNELQPLYAKLEGETMNKAKREEVKSVITSVVKRRHELIREELSKSSNNSAIVGASSIHYETEMANKIKLPTVSKTLSINDEHYKKSLIHRKYTSKKLSDGKRYSDRVRGYNNKMITETTSKVSKNIREDKDWSKMSDSIKKTVGKTNKRVINIQEVESERIKEEAKADAAKQEGVRGITKEKTWITVEDDNVRHTHMDLHGVTIFKDEYFETPNGQALHPRGFGIAGEDINCRCKLKYNTIAIEGIDDLSDDFGGVMSYEDWMENSGYYMK